MTKKRRTLIHPPDLRSIGPEAFGTPRHKESRTLADERGMQICNFPNCGQPATTTDSIGDPACAAHTSWVSCCECGDVAFFRDRAGIPFCPVHAPDDAFPLKLARS